MEHHESIQIQNPIIYNENNGNNWDYDDMNLGCFDEDVNYEYNVI